MASAKVAELVRVAECKFVFAIHPLSVGKVGEFHRGTSLGYGRFRKGGDGAPGYRIIDILRCLHALLGSFNEGVENKPVHATVTSTGRIFGKLLP